MSADLGIDRSGNGNNWSVTNMTYVDQMLDSPTNNFATLNPTDQWTGGTLSEGNLKIALSGGNYYYYPTVGVSTGKWYWEVQILTVGARNNLGVFSHQNSSLTTEPTNYGSIILGNTSVYTTATDNYTVPSISVGDIIAFAFDADNGKLFIGHNAIPVVSGDGHIYGLPSDTYFMGGRETSSTSGTNIFNYGQDSSFAGTKTAQGNQDDNSIGDFYYDVPANYLALCTSNLPAVDVVPSEHFNTVLYTGDGGTQAVTGVGFQPDLVWLKERSSTSGHGLFDAVRGVQKVLRSSDTGAEEDQSNYLTVFGTDGFTVGDDGSVNQDTITYVAWNWKANGSGSSNSDGNVTTTVSANTDAGFSIVTWTGDGSGPNTYGHGLDLAPEFVTVKRRNDTGVWYTWFKGITSNYAVFLNDTNAQQNDGNITAVSATTITAADGIMTDSNTFVAYCWHSVEGYSKIGLYEGNNSTDGTFIYTGFRPMLVVVKDIDSTGGWILQDTKRTPYNYAPVNTLIWSSNAAEYSTDRDDLDLDFLSNGFKHRSSYSGVNAARTYIYIAFAETPFKYSNAR